MASVSFTILSKKISPSDIAQSATKHGLTASLESSMVSTSDKSLLDDWLNLFSKKVVTFTYLSGGLIPKAILNRAIDPRSTDTLLPSAIGRSWFNAAEIATIYKIPSPTQSTKVVLGVVSFGGGLYGSIDADGVLTNGDLQAYWTYIGISPSNHPRVIVKPINGATNNTSDYTSTAENTLDIETVGGCCPSSNLTIILYISPNTVQSLYDCFNYALNTPVISGGLSYKPTIISCSWGIPEVYVNTSFLKTFDTLLSTASARGINVCTASGDYGSNNGVGGTSTNVDFPSSCPNVIAVGGTNLVCPNNIYDGSTVEKAWSNGGGAISRVYSKPSYQRTIVASGRSVPDIALVADPATGVIFIINGSYYVYGGTSVAAPVCAGFFAAINTNKFANTVFYANKSGFNDILIGSNGAYSAQIGHDNCTGLGSIKGDVLSRLLSAPSIPAVLGTSVTLSPATLTVNIGQTSLIVPTVFPTTATNKNLLWASSNTGIATVTNGTVTGVAAGSAVIRATTTDGSNKSGSCAIIVNMSVDSVSLGISLTVNGTATLLGNILPTDATNKNLTWLSSNTLIATVVNGVVTARAAGSATITVTTASGAKTSTILVTVR
jgi:subtilase family serine protease